MLLRRKKSKLNTRFWLAILVDAVLVILAVTIFYRPTHINENFNASVPDKFAARVSYVIDGDTIVLDNNEHVRLLSINSTEKGEVCYNEAREYLRDLIGDNKIKLITGQKKRDNYGRILAWVYAEDQNLNIAMVRAGLARVYIFDEKEFAPELRTAEEEAREEGRGCLWGENN